MTSVTSMTSVKSVAPATQAFRWTDAHAHWAQTFPESTSNAALAAAIAILREQGMERSFQGGVGPADWRRQLEIQERHPDFIRPVLGLHPWWVKDHDLQSCEAALAELAEIFERNASEIAAVGELGLDFSRGGKSSADLQIHVFKRQLELAQNTDKPLVLHVVHAHEEAFRILRSHSQNHPFRGIVHAFSGSIEVARQYLALGLKLSIGPGISEPGRFAVLKKTLPQLAPGDWVIESDAVGERFFRTVQAASGLTGWSIEQVAAATNSALRESGLLES